MAFVLPTHSAARTLLAMNAFDVALSFGSLVNGQLPFFVWMFAFNSFGILAARMAPSRVGLLGMWLQGQMVFTLGA